ncbi:cell wall protein IFF6-like [Rosa rugosa]|uniref:cell wall protein IFF6-like n=1 Tax=Rosa rugosa TaxID=74645 RepID=UPI002B40A394|nr:cell wall protein IFF6-like [Rosa rugosa]
MAALAEPAFVSANTKKEEKNKKREEKYKELEEKKKKNKEEEERKNKEHLRMLVDLHRNKEHNVKQVSRVPATRVPPVSSATSYKNHHSQPHAPNAGVKASVTHIPAAAWAKAVAPISATDVSKRSDIDGHSQSQASKAPVKAAETPNPTGSVKPSSIAISQQPAAVTSLSSSTTSTAGSTETAFFVGQILVKTPINNQPNNVSLFEMKKETQATIVETQQTGADEVQEGNKQVEEGVNAMTYASALQKNKAAEAQKTQGNNNNASVVTTSLPVLQENSAPHTKTTNHVTNEFKNSQYQAAQKGPVKSNSSTSTVSSERSYNSGPRRTNGPEQKYHGNGRRVTNGGGNGSGQKYHGNGRRVTNGGNGFSQRYYGNGRVTNKIGPENQKKEAKPKPVIDAEGWQLVEYRSGRRGERV